MVGKQRLRREVGIEKRRLWESLLSPEGGLSRAKPSTSGVGFALGKAEDLSYC
jgi:hypothetical protein